MSKTSYKSWEVKGESIRAYGGERRRYTHYCPLADFKKIVTAMTRIIQKNGRVSSIDIYGHLKGVKMKSGRPFSRTTQEYKVKVAFDILIMEGLLARELSKKVLTKKRGRSPYSYVLNVSERDMLIWLSGLGA